LYSLDLINSISWINYPATFLYDMTVVALGMFVAFYWRLTPAYFLVPLYFGLAIWYQTT